MRILFRISLILLSCLLSLGIVPLVWAAPLVIPEDYSSNQTSNQYDSLRQECFTNIDIESLERCKSLIVQDQTDAKAWNQLGRIYYGFEKYEEAYLAFTYATFLRADYSIAWANTCAVLNQLQDYESALKACNRSLSLSSASEEFTEERALAWSNKAIVLYFLGRYKESIDALDEVLSLDPDDYQAKLNRIFILHVLANTTSSENEDIT